MAETPWTPLLDKVIVRRETPDEMLSREANIAVADQFKKDKNRGTIIAAGPGRLVASGQLIPLTVKVGDLVLFGQHSGVPLEEKDLLMLREDEILAYQHPVEGA